TFLAAVIVGQEPKLLPLYMLQVLKEVEDRYGNVLEKWTGLLHQLDGIDEMIKKLVFVAKNPTADMGALSESPVTLTAMAIDALGTAQATEANELLAKAQSTLETDIQLAWQFIEQARTQADLVKSQLRERMGDILTAARDTVADMERIRTTVAQAQAVHGDLSDVEALLQKAEDAMRLEDLKGAESLIDRAEVTAKAKVEGLLKDRYPRLFLETTNAGLQANRWNRFEMNITNKGNWPAEHVTPIVSGPVEVLGLRTIEKIEPNQKVSLEFGLKPKEAGTMDFDFEVHYTRPLDDGKHQTTDTAVVRVESETGYLIDDGLLFHSTGALVCHESRTFLPPEEASRAANLEAKVKEFVNRAFPNGGKSIQTATFGGTTVLAARDGQSEFLTWARKSIEREGFGQAVAVLRQVSDATVGPTEEISRQIRQTIIASKEAGTLQISDEQVNAYVDFLRLTLEAAFQAKHRGGIERYWPVARIAIKTVDQLGYDAVSSFRKVI